MHTESFIKGLGEITYTPITSFQIIDGNYVPRYTYPTVPFGNVLAENFPKRLLQSTVNAKIGTAGQLMYYGFVRTAPDSFFIIGPIIEVPMNNQVAQFLLQKLSLPISSTKELLQYYENTPHYTIYKLANILSFICKSVNDESLTAHEILPDEYSSSVDESDKEYAPAKPAEPAVFRNSEAFEKEMYSYVFSGQYAKMKNYIKQASYSGDIGSLSKSQMTSNKYLVIVSVALASRAAYLAGVPYETAMSQADFFIKKVDSATSFDELFQAHKHMLLSFTQLVAERKFGKPVTSMFYKVQNYILEHLADKISTEDIAQELQVNRTYLSRIFKKETGSTLVDYIHTLKMDEAKRLLITTDKSLIAIANSLSFSSQSQFQMIFKKVVGCTPTEFKKQMHHL